MNHEVIIDLLTIVVMGLAVYYAARLNRSLTRARDGRAELVQLIASLTDAQSRAESAIQSMKMIAAEYELSLSKQIAVSRGLADELSIINDTGNTLASRLERLAPLARGNVEATRYAAELDSPGRAGDGLRAERSLAVSADLKPVHVKAGDKPQGKMPTGTVVPSTRSEKTDTAPKPSPAPAAAQNQTTPAEATGNRSRAERELFAAIETLRKGRVS